jgi:hypothetical protein
VEIAGHFNALAHTRSAMIFVKFEAFPFASKFENASQKF